MMPGYVVQITLIFLLTTCNTEARKPPGYIAPPKEYDPNPPKYEYGYRIQQDKTAHGKDERRDGIYAQGRYYVENGTDSSQEVKYFADEWGYHPVVEYSHVGPRSRSSASFVLGEEAIKLKNNQKSIPQDPLDPGKADNLSKLPPTAFTQNVYAPVQSSNPEANTKELQILEQPPLIIREPVFISENFQSPCSNPSTVTISSTPAYLDNLLENDLADKIENRQLETATKDPNTDLESLPQPEALIGARPDNPWNLERAALVKTPNHIVRIAPKVHYTEFGNRLPPKQSTSKLIETTKNFVTGADVLNINAAVSSTPGAEEIETNTLHSLLHRYVTPSIESSTSTTRDSQQDESLLSQPIVVADTDKLVTEHKQKLSSSTLAAPLHGEEAVLVTPRPIGSKFLAPITAGVQLQHVEEQQSEDSNTVETHKEQQEKLEVEVLKTTPYYLGMYQYPLGLDSTENLTSNVEVKAVQDIELGKTLQLLPGVQTEQLPHLVSDQSSAGAVTPETLGVDYLSGNKPAIIQQPYFFRRPNKPYLLQIPGLFSQQKYKTLLQGYRHPLSFNHFYYPSERTRPINPYVPQVSHYLPPKPKLKLDLLVFPRDNVFNLPPITKNFRQSSAKLNNAYLPPVPKQGGFDSKAEGSKSAQYVELVPPKKSAEGQKQRSARAHFDEKSVRMEYGFKPPLRPSVEIDEYGRPIERDDNKD